MHYTTGILRAADRRGGRRSGAGMELAALVAAGMAAASADAHAYIDPGTGSYLFQIGTAAAFAALFLVKRWWRDIKGFFRPAPTATVNRGADDADGDHGHVREE